MIGIIRFITGVFRTVFFKIFRTNSSFITFPLSLSIFNSFVSKVGLTPPYVYHFFFNAITPLKVGFFNQVFFKPLVYLWCGIKTSFFFLNYLIVILIVKTSLDFFLFFIFLIVCWTFSFSSAATTGVFDFWFFDSWSPSRRRGDARTADERWDAAMREREAMHERRAIERQERERETRLLNGEEGRLPMRELAERRMQRELEQGILPFQPESQPAPRLPFQPESQPQPAPLGPNSLVERGMQRRLEQGRLPTMSELAERGMQRELEQFVIF